MAEERSSPDTSKDYILPSPQPVVAAKTGKFVSWCRLLRVPNLFTVPGDPMAGFFLALITVNGITANLVTELLISAAISLLMYSAGLLFNDMFDLKEDLRDRPSRPLPSGTVRPASVVVVGTVFILGGLAMAWTIGPETIFVCIALASCILIYDGLAKHIPVVGPILMGACRGMSVLVGASAIGILWDYRNPALWFALIITLYIAAVTFIAKDETTGKPVGFRRFGPVITMSSLLIPYIVAESMLIMFFVASLNSLSFQIIMALCCSLISFSLAFWCFLKLCEVTQSLGKKDVYIPKNIGVLIRLLIPVQVIGVLSLFVTKGIISKCDMAEQNSSIICAGVLLLFWPLAYFVGKKFYSS